MCSYRSFVLFFFFSLIFLLPQRPSSVTDVGLFTPPMTDDSPDQSGSKKQTTFPFQKGAFSKYSRTLARASSDDIIFKPEDIDAALESKTRQAASELKPLKQDLKNRSSVSYSNSRSQSKSSTDKQSPIAVAPFNYESKYYKNTNTNTKTHSKATKTSTNRKQTRKLFTSSKSNQNQRQLLLTKETMQDKQNYTQLNNSFDKKNEHNQKKSDSKNSAKGSLNGSGFDSDNGSRNIRISSHQFSNDLIPNINDNNNNIENNNNNIFKMNNNQNKDSNFLTISKLQLGADKYKEEQIHMKWWQRIFKAKKICKLYLFLVVLHALLLYILTFFAIFAKALQNHTVLHATYCYLALFITFCFVLFSFQSIITDNEIQLRCSILSAVLMQTFLVWYIITDETLTTAMNTENMGLMLIIITFITCCITLIYVGLYVKVVGSFGWYRYNMLDKASEQLDNAFEKITGLFCVFFFKVFIINIVFIACILYCMCIINFVYV